MVPINNAETRVESKSTATRERILLCAAELFCEQGYDAASLRGIAKHADMQAASIYYYFETKEDILAAVLSRGLTELNDTVIAALKTLPTNANTRDRLECAIDSHLKCLVDGGVFPATFMSVYLHLPDKARYRKSQAREKYFDLWLAILKRGVDYAELRTDLNLTLARRFILVSITRSVEWEEFDEYSSTELAKFFTQTFFEGIA